MIKNKIRKTTTVDYYDKGLYYFDIYVTVRDKKKKKNIKCKYFCNINNCSVTVTVLCSRAK